MNAQVETTSHPLGTNEIFLLCLLVATAGVGVIIAIAWFGNRIFGKSQYDFWGLERFLSFWTDQNIRPNIPRYFLDALTESLQRRNEFWITYGQIITSTLIIVILTILLLTKTISAEAGLPLLSAVTGFAIAKGVNGSNRSSAPGPERDQG